MAWGPFVRDLLSWSITEPLAGSLLQHRTWRLLRSEPKSGFHFGDQSLRLLAFDS